MYFSKFVSIVTLLMVAMGVASAQQLKDGSVIVSSDGEEVENYELASQFSRFEVGESVMLVSGLSKVHEFGMRVGILRAWKLTDTKAPVYLHLGAELNYNSTSDTYKFDEEDENTEEHMMNFAFPVNLALNIPLNGRCCMELLSGLNLRFNVLGTTKVGSNKVNYLSDGYANRFSPGANFGFGFNIHRFSVLYRYTMDFNDYFKDDVTDTDGNSFDSRFRFHALSFGITLK